MDTKKTTNNDMDKNQKRIAELEALIVYHQNAYYNNVPEITDAAFDALWDELKALDPGNKILQSVGKDAADGFPKREHIMPMGSQEKAADPDEFLAWSQKQSFDEFVVEYKLDGASLELQYENGVLAAAVTRGDGTVGDEITANAVKMRGVLQKLPNSWGGAIRCEVVMLKEIHKKYFSDKANCRNAANGVMKRKDGKGAEHLSVLCYDGVPHGVFEKGKVLTKPCAPFDDELSKLEWLTSLGFEVVPAVVCRTAYEVIDYRARVVAEREHLPYDIDGLVVKGRAVDPQDMARPRPEKQIAFKFPLEEAVTTLRGVEWSESGMFYTPIALVDPVKLAGTAVKRANLVNTNAITGMGLRIGSRVVVVKRGEIIPKIEGKVDDEPGATPIPVPDMCQVCGAKLVDEGTRLYCPNTLCPKRALHRLQKWVQMLDIKDFGTAVLTRLYEAGKVKTVADLYRLTVEDLVEIERMGETLAKKLLQNLRAKRVLRFPDFLAALDIDGIGPLMAEKLAQAGCSSLTKLCSATIDELTTIPGFGEVLAKNLVLGLKELRAEIDDIVTQIELEQPEGEAVLVGQSFCFTGELNSMKRAEAEALVKKLGGMVRSSVTKDLTYLVTNDPHSGSAKNKQAERYGTAIISEEEFLALTGKN